MQCARHRKALLLLLIIDSLSAAVFFRTGTPARERKRDNMKLAARMVFQGFFYPRMLKVFKDMVRDGVAKSFSRF